MKLKEIAERINCQLYGDGEVEIKRVRALRDAKEGDITIYFWGGKGEIENSKASAFLCDEPIPGKNTIVADRKGFMNILNKLLAIFEVVENFNKGIHLTVILGENVKLGESVSIGAYTVIGDNVEIGDHTVIYPHVVVYPNVKIGKNCKIHSGTVLRGGTIIEDNVEIDVNSAIATSSFERGFGRKRLELKPLCGGVIIKRDVFIGALTNITKSIMSDSII